MQRDRCGSVSASAGSNAAGRDHQVHQHGGPEQIDCNPPPMKMGARGTVPVGGGVVLGGQMRGQVRGRGKAHGCGILGGCAGAPRSSGCGVIHLGLEVILQPHLVDQFDLGFEVVDVLFGFFEDVLEQFA